MDRILKKKSSLFLGRQTTFRRPRNYCSRMYIWRIVARAKNKKENEIIKNYWENLPKAKHESLWIEAGEYSSENNLASKGVGLIDAAIIIAAQRSNVRIWTLDKKLHFILGRDRQFIPKG